MRNGKIKSNISYEDVISPDNLLEAWQEFLSGKRKKPDVQKFSLKLMDNIISLHNHLSNFTYKHGGYQAFNISDPKPRNIHKASVRDRLVHHAIYRQLYPFFARTFIADSYSCQMNKGTHKAIYRFQAFAYKESKNHTKTCYVLKCDIRKFFATIDHEILVWILTEHIEDESLIGLLKNIIGSFSTPSALRATSPCEGEVNLSALDKGRCPEGRGVLQWRKVGLPLGNLTSQLFVNIYMNKFDQFIKHRLKAKYYIRYADDFVLFSRDKRWLEEKVVEIGKFLNNELKIELHPDKVFIKTISSGVDFLGWVNFQDHRVLRTTTKRRMIKRIKEHTTKKTMASYLGLLKHGNAYKLKQNIRLIITAVYCKNRQNKLE